MTKNTILPQPNTKLVNWGVTSRLVHILKSHYKSLNHNLLSVDSFLISRSKANYYLHIQIERNGGKIFLGTEIVKETRRQKIDTRKGSVCYWSCPKVGISQFTLKSRQHTYRVNTRDPYYYRVSLDIPCKAVRSTHRAIIEETPTYSNSKQHPFL